MRESCEHNQTCFCAYCWRGSWVAFWLYWSSLASKSKQKLMARLFLVRASPKASALNSLIANSLSAMVNTWFANTFSAFKQTLSDRGLGTTFNRFCLGIGKQRVLFLNEKTQSTTLAFPPRRAERRDLKGLVGLCRKQLVCQRWVWKHSSR